MAHRRLVTLKSRNKNAKRSQKKKSKEYSLASRKRSRRLRNGKRAFKLSAGEKRNRDAGVCEILTSLGYGQHRRRSVPENVTPAGTTSARCVLKIISLPNV